MELNEFELCVVRRVPETLEFGVLYVCFECNVIVHLCACGCGEKVVLPINPDFWCVKYDGEHISISPSVGNFQFGCKSHYWIRENKVVWVRENIKESNCPAQCKPTHTFYSFVVGLLKRLFINR